MHVAAVLGLPGDVFRRHLEDIHIQSDLLGTGSHGFINIDARRKAGEQIAHELFLLLRVRHDADRAAGDH